MNFIPSRDVRGCKNSRSKVVLSFQDVLFSFFFLYEHQNTHTNSSRMLKNELGFAKGSKWGWRLMKERRLWTQGCLNRVQTLKIRVWDPATYTQRTKSTPNVRDRVTIFTKMPFWSNKQQFSYQGLNVEIPKYQDVTSPIAT